MPVKLDYNPDNKPYAQKLRREMTREEAKLWYRYLRGYGIRFRRQKQFGNYIVDFYCSAAMLVVELDGSQHYEPEAVLADAKRTQYLEELGLKVLRFSNADVNQRFEGVCEMIDQAVNARTAGNLI